MTHISGIAEAVLYVQDLAIARQFYTQVLGLPVTQQFNDACFLQTGQHATLILFQLDKLHTRTSIIPAHGATGRGHVCFAIPPDQIATWRNRLTIHNIEIEHEQTWSFGTHSLYFRDPDNNSLELMDNTHYPQVWQKIQPPN